MKKTVLAVTILGALVAACGGTESTTSPQKAEQPAVPAKKAPKTAGEFVEALRASGLPIGRVQVYTAESDPNSLLGRPGGYVHKANFHDTRIELDPEFRSEPNEVRASDGGSVEIFGDEAGARRRTEFLQTLSQNLPMAGEYTYQSGTVVLRVSKELTPDQAAQYEQALKEIR
ncbi:MAG: hypothetical protein M3O70_13450 [Actinomycetota bacterium]|nr:hypothetical protein [Actinomycetota bacterium]